jgi:hypothetical protein
VIPLLTNDQPVDHLQDTKGFLFPSFLWGVMGDLADWQIST